MDNKTRVAILNHKAVNFYDSIIPQVQRICKDFLDKTGVKHFWYNRYYYNNTAMTINNLKNYNDRVILKHNMLNFPQIWKHINNNLAVGESYKSMWPVEGKELKEISKDLKIYHPFNIFFKNKNNIECLGLADDNPNSDLSNFFLNADKLCINFLSYFKEEAKHILQQAEKNLIYFPDVEPNSFKIYKVSEITQNYLPNRNITVKELYCLRLLYKGQSYKEISNNLNISSRTVEDRIRNIKNKLSLFSRSQLVEYYIKIS